MLSFQMAFESPPRGTCITCRPQFDFPTGGHWRFVMDGLTASIIRTRASFSNHRDGRDVDLPKRAVFQPCWLRSQGIILSHSWRRSRRQRPEAGSRRSESPASFSKTCFSAGSEFDQVRYNW